MCFIYEDQYHRCFDPLFFSEEPEFIQMDGGDGEMVSVQVGGPSESLVDMLRDVYNVKIVDELKFANTVMHMFKEMHDVGVIVPGDDPLKSQ